MCRLPPSLQAKDGHDACARKGSAAMPIDLKQFLPYVEHCDLTEEQKLELLADLWSIMESFADEAWGLCPTQHFANDNARFSSNKPLITIDYFNATNANEPLPGAESGPKKRQR
jgi:hypothetical protein